MALPDQVHALSRDDIFARAASKKLRGVFQIEDAVYHAAPGLSSTRLKKLLVSPRHYLTSLAENEDTPALRLGRAVHCAVLEPEQYLKRYVGEPDIDRRTKDGKAKYAEWLKEHGTKCMLTDDQIETVIGVKTALSESPTFKRIATYARPELSAYAPCDETGVLRKAKADLITFDGSMIADVKTTEDATPEAFSRAIGTYGYHISAAYYLDVWSAALGHPVNDFVWIVVEKKPPYGVRFYAASQRVLEEGRARCTEALKTFATCDKTQEWPGYPETFEELDMPFYFYRSLK